MLYLCVCRIASPPATVSFLTVNEGLPQGMIFDILLDRVDVLEPVSRCLFHLKHEGKPLRLNQFEETLDGSLWLLDLDRVWKISIQNDLLAKAAEQGNANIQSVSIAISTCGRKRPNAYFWKIAITDKP